MSNNREIYCKHCGKETLFFEDSDMHWYCDECEEVLDSIPQGEDDELDLDCELDFCDELDFPVVRCPSCNNLVSAEDVVDGQYCPICYEDLSKELAEVDEKNED